MALGTGATSFLNAIKSIISTINGKIDKANEEIAKKQNKITGTSGQIVGFDSSGNPTAQAAPATGVTSFKGRTGAVTPSDGDYTASQVGAVPTSRKVNSKALTADITLSASDVGALPTTGGSMTGTISFDVPETSEDAFVKVGGYSSIVAAKSEGTDVTLGRFDGKAEVWFESYDPSNGDWKEDIRVGIWGVASPKTGSSATNKEYVDNKVAEYLPLSGGTMTGSIKYEKSGGFLFQMGDNTDIARTISTEGNQHIGIGLNSDGTSAIWFQNSTQDRSEDKRIILRGVKTPELDSDAANKAYVDAHAGGGFSAPAYVAGGITFISTNEYIQSSYSKMLWTVKVSCTVSFKCRCYAESSYDFLTITYEKNDGTSSTILNALSSNNDVNIPSESYPLPSIEIGDKLWFEYRKDSSQNKNEDCAKISDISVTYNDYTIKITSVGALQYFFDISTPDGSCPFAVLSGTGGSSTVNLASGVTGTLPIENGGTGNTTGTAAYATQLSTARAIQTNLSSTSSASFNGTADVNPGVYGTLPVPYGGTGLTTLVNTAYTTSQVRGIAFATSTPSSVSNGCITLVYV